MKKVAHIMYTIGYVFAIIGIVAFFAGSLFFVGLGIAGFFGSGFAENFFSAYSSAVSRTEVMLSAVVIGLYGLMFAFAFVTMGVLEILTLVFTKRARREGATFKDHITAGVFGFISDNPFITVGGVLSAIAVKREERNQPQVVDVEAKDK